MRTLQGSKPDLAWLPVRYINDIVDGRKKLEEVLAYAPGFGFEYVELHHSFILGPEHLDNLLAELERLGLGVAALTCGPDFTNPDPTVRKSQVSDMKRQVDIAHQLGADAIRATSGIGYPGVSLSDGLDWAVDGLLTVAEYAETQGVKLCVENHYRDRIWEEGKLDFAVDLDTFLELYDRLEETPVMITFDTAQPMFIDIDEIALLKHVKDKVYHVHAGDRNRRERPHVVIGTGMVDYDSVFAILKSISYDRFISVEDGSAEGDNGLRQGLDFLRSKMAAQWGSS